MKSLRQHEIAGHGRGLLVGLTATLGAVLVVLSACGGGTLNSSNSSQNQQQKTATLQVNIGDAPSDRLVAFDMTISSMTFTNSAGTAVPVVSSSATTEMVHLMGTMQPLSLMQIPQGTYTKASITMSNMAAVYMNPANGQMVQQTIAGPMTSVVSFSPSLTLSSSPMIANFDLDMANSVVIDNMGNANFSPVFTVSMNTCCSGGGSPYDGGIQHMIGSVGSFSGNSFSFGMMESSSPMTIATNANTQFVGMSGMGMMSSKQIVMVDATMQPDGSMTATEIEDVMSSGGAMAMGLVTSLTGNPVNQLTLVANDVSGSGMMSSSLGGVMTVNVGSAISFSIDSDGVDMANLPFTPIFDATNIFKGQFVDADSNSAMMSGGMGGGMMGGGTLTATGVRLEQQGLSGTVSAYLSNGSQATFTLTLPSGSAFTTLSGANTVVVFQQAGTQMTEITSIINGSAVHVRGLLFLDAGTYKLVASRIMGP
jgi:hypothetical protein